MSAKITKKVETFRFEDENDYEYEIWFKVFSPEKIALLSLLKVVEPSSDYKMLKRLTFDNLFSPQRHSR